MPDPTPTICARLDPLDRAILMSLLAMREPDGPDPDETDASTWGSSKGHAGPGSDPVTTVVDRADELVEERERGERAGRKGKRR